eukprot:4434031-Amphidinium_carterae.1
MNTYEVAPDPYATVRHCHDDRSASGVHESCSVFCDQNLGSGPSTRVETEQSRPVSDDPVCNDDAWAHSQNCKTEEGLPRNGHDASVRNGCPPSHVRDFQHDRFNMEFVNMGSGFANMNSGSGPCVGVDGRNVP